jgi:hypothetical protein
VTERKADPYSPRTIWYKVNNPAYTQAEGRGGPSSISLANTYGTVLTAPVPRDNSTSAIPRQRHTRRKPGPQSHGSSPPPRRRPPDVTQDTKTAELPNTVARRFSKRTLA